MNSFEGDKPYVTIKVSGEVEKEIEALVDTGSDLTVLTFEICEEMGLSTSGYEEAEGIGGIAFLPTFECTIELAGERFNNTVIVGSEMGPLLGRDLLQNFKLELDWKRQIICIEDP
jgi:predicted aspartyl protease